MLRACLDLGTRSTLLVCNPVPASMAMAAADVPAAADRAEQPADAAALVGKARTPFLLAAMAEITDGRSLEANLALLEDNARLAGMIAAAAAAAAPARREEAPG